MARMIKERDSPDVPHPHPRRRADDADPDRTTERAAIDLPN
jgi:hypothetical protein